MTTTEPYRHCRGYLPHLENRQLQSITFRLYDSVPKEKIQQWRIQLESEEEKVCNQSEELEDKLRSMICQYEDMGCGQCFLRDSKVASLVEKALMHFDGER